LGAAAIFFASIETIVVIVVVVVVVAMEVVEQVPGWRSVMVGSRPRGSGQGTGSLFDFSGEMYSAGAMGYNARNEW
jgi:hypothetical protein